MNKCRKWLTGFLFAAVILTLLLPLTARATEKLPLEVDAKTGRATFTMTGSYNYMLRVTMPSGDSESMYFGKSSDGTAKVWSWPCAQYFKDSGRYMFQVFGFDPNGEMTYDTTKAIAWSDLIIINWSRPNQQVSTPAQPTLVKDGTNYVASCKEVANVGQYMFKLYCNGKTYSTRWTIANNTTFTEEYLKSIMKSLDVDELKVFVTVQANSGDLTQYANSGVSSESNVVLLKNENAKPIISPSLKNVDTGVKITWSKFSGAAKYRIFKKDANGKWAKLTTVSTNSYIDTAIKPYEKATYAVVALSSGGAMMTKYGDGKTITFTVAPTVVTAKYKAAGVYLTWKSTSKAAKYRIFRKTENGAWTKIATTTDLNYTDSTAIYGKTYTYGVRGLTSGGSFVNDLGDGTVITYLAPAPAVTLANQGDGIKITWKALSGAAKYRIFVKKSGEWTKLATVTDGRNYVDSAVKNGKSYTYAVVGMDSAGRYMNDYGTGATITRVVNEVKITLKSVASGVKITWGAFDGAGKYRVYRKNSDGSWTALATVKTGETLAYRDTAAEDGKTYTYTVVAMTSGGKAISDYGTGTQIKYVKPVTADIIEEVSTDGVIIISEFAEDVIEEDTEDIEDEDVIEEDTEDIEDEDVIEEDTEDIEDEDGIEEDTEDIEDEDGIEEDTEDIEDEDGIEEDTDDVEDEDAIESEEETSETEEAVETEETAEEEEAVEEASEEVSESEEVSSETDLPAEEAAEIA